MQYKEFISIGSAMDQEMLKEVLQAGNEETQKWEVFSKYVFFLISLNYIRLKQKGLCFFFHVYNVCQYNKILVIELLQ